MKKVKLPKLELKKIFAFTLTFALLSTSFLPFVQTPLSPQRSFAEGNACLASAGSMSQGKAGTTNMPLPQGSRIGASTLEEAAKYLTQISDIKGAYYDSGLDRIVIIGENDTSMPPYHKDDLGTVVHSVIYHQSAPSISIDNDPANPSGSNALVTYYGGVKNTRMGKMLFDGDNQFKSQIIGVYPDGTSVTSAVSGYKSVPQRYVEKNPSNVQASGASFSMHAKDVSIKRDDVNKSFVFDDTLMEVTGTAGLPGTDLLWDQAVAEFAQHMTDNFDAYAAEEDAYRGTKQVTKLAAFVKWLKDASIVTDFSFARDYKPTRLDTPAYVAKRTYQNGPFSVTGSIDFNTANTYTQDSGISSGLKTASEAIPTTKEDIAWTFTDNGTQYQAIAVTANAFRTLGSYNRTETDFSFPTAGDLILAFQRSYSSYSGNQQGVGRGWSVYPAVLYNSKPAEDTVLCGSETHPKGLALVSQTGGFESFTMNNCNDGYVADEGEYHSNVAHNQNGTFTVILKDQTVFTFNTNYQLSEIKDKNGNRLTYSYDSEDKLATIADSQSHMLTMTYNNEDLISEITDWSNRKVKYTYDSDGNLLTVTDPKDKVTTYSYNDDEKLVSITDRTGQQIVTNTYTNEAKVATQVDAVNVTKSHTYDKENKIITTTDNQSPSRTYTTKYDEKGRVLEQKDPLNNTVTYTYGTELAPLTVKDKRNNTITNTYDSDGNLTSITYPDTKQVTHEYNAENRITKITDGRYGTPGKETTFTYDATGNLTQQNEAGKTTTYTYNSAGEALTETDPLSHVTTWTRDTFGNPLTEKDALNRITTYTFDTLGRLTQITDANGKQFSQTYDAVNNILTRTNAFGTTTNLYDNEGRLTKVTLPNNAITEYTYNAAGTLTLVKDALNNNTNYGYDGYQNLLTQQNALNNTTTHVYDKLNNRTQSNTPLNKVRLWEYDANGNITKRIDANNVSTNYAYDAFNRLTTITYPDATTVTFSYDNRGNRTQMVDPIGTSTYTYDSFDRLTQSTNVYGQTIQYQYDNVGNLTKLIYPDGRDVDYVYDVNNRMTTVTDWNNKVTSYTYQDNGLLATRTYPNGIVTTYSYDNANRLSQIEHVKSGSSKIKNIYTRDSVGNVTNIARSGGFYVLPQPISYTYDALGRVLTQSSDDHEGDRIYTYDTVGNILSKQKDGGSTTNYTYDADNKLLTIGSYSQSYDDNGNLRYRNTNGSGKWLEYDKENRMKKFGSNYTIKYDGDGTRLEVGESIKTRFVTDISGELSQVLAETDDDNDIENWIIYGVGLISEGGDSSYVEREYYLESGIGNEISLTTYNGVGTPIYYDAYGNIEYGGHETFGFAEQQYDTDTELNYMRARYYDPEIGRFISKDPFEGVLSDPRGHNGYDYAYNNPVNLSDPSGENPVAQCAVGAINLAKSLASQQQLGEKGIIIAGPGVKRAFDNAAIIAEEYGGVALDWVKKSSSAFTSPEGVKFQTHWVENINTGKQVLYKTKFLPE